jgi:hypothetical protein
LFENFLAEHLWLALILWWVVYIADYYLTIYGAILYHSSLKEHIVFEGSFELTPYFQEDIDTLRHFSPRFIRALVLSSILIGLLWFLAVKVINFPHLFSFVMGGLLLRELAIHLRHGRNLVLSRLARGTAGLRGRVEYSRWVILNLSAFDLWSYGGLFLLLGLATRSWFILGGALSCLVTGWQHWRWSRKLDRSMPPEGGEVKRKPSHTYNGCGFCLLMGLFRTTIRFCHRLL